MPAIDNEPMFIWPSLNMSFNYQLTMVSYWMKNKQQRDRFVSELLEIIHLRELQGNHEESRHLCTFLSGLLLNDYNNQFN